jgi:hypothetical protein
VASVLQEIGPHYLIDEERCFRLEIISASQAMASFLDRLKRTETTGLKFAASH